MKNPQTPSPALLSVLEAVAAGRLSIEQAVAKIDPFQTLSLPNATVDLGRAARCRFGEVIYGEGKSAELILQITKSQLAYGQSVLVTRLGEADADAIQSQLSDVHCLYHPLARTLRISKHGHEQQEKELEHSSRSVVAVVTAGSTDNRVAAEAVQTLEWMNVLTEEIQDVGVAGPQRLLAVVPRLRQADVIIVIAGMEAALASAVGGHVACPIIGVPTSVGYGTSFGGVTALLGMLSSCASNVTVVGIDAGFKGAYVAGLIATQLDDAKIRSSNEHANE